MTAEQEEALFYFLGLQVVTNEEIEAFELLARAFGRNVVAAADVADAKHEQAEGLDATLPHTPADQASEKAEKVAKK